jgi:uncharacterized protein (TIGR00290 family)
MYNTSVKRALLSWSSGKDSAWTLHLLRRDPGVRVEGLLTTVNTTHDRVAMHAVRRGLLEAQAEAAGLPLWIVPLPWPCPNEAYEEAMSRAVRRAEEAGITHMAFGDLFLEDVRAYRIERLSRTSLAPLFPLWGWPTAELAREMIDAGVEAILTCVDPKKLDRSFAGRQFDRILLADLPAGVDPCGENGEFHTFVANGPMFRAPIAVKRGEIVERDGFVFADLEQLSQA